MISDNRKGIRKETSIENLDLLGLKLVNSHTYQLNDELELKKKNGTDFIIKSTVIKKTI